MRRYVLFLLMLSIFPCHLSPAQPANSRKVKNTTFSAVYDRLLDYYTHDINVSHVAFSGDGEKIFFSGSNTSSDLVLYTLDADGGNMSSVAVPGGVTGVDAVTISQNGSRAFFLESGNDYLYKVEGGAAVEILDRSTVTGIGNIADIAVTADGSTVYLHDGDDIWRIGHDGSTPELVVDDEAVVRSEGAGRLIDNFAISADGSVIGFVLKGYAEAGGAYRTKNEVFAYDGGNIIQLTDDTENVYKEHMNMSDDGSTIVYSSGNPQNQYYSIQTNGTSRVAVAEKHSNFQALSLTYDGSQVLYDDGGGRGGRLLNTDGTWGIDLFPEWDVNTIALGISDNGTISDDGSRICFRLQLRSFPSRYALYVGYLYQTGVVADAPVIESITFDPLTMPRGDPDARVTLLAQISDPDGLDDIDEVSTDELVDGVSELGKSEVPVYFYFNARDNGNSPDAVEGDGIFSTRGEPGDRINELDEVTLRVGAMDMTSTVVVMDAVLQIGGGSGGTVTEDFTAVYDRLLDYYTHDINVSHVAFSGDGEKIFFSGSNTSSDLVLYTLDADGGNMSSVAVPGGVTGVDAVTISQNGSRAFFLESGNDYLYKVEGGAAVEILDRSTVTGIGNIADIAVTADGSTVYLHDGDDIWRIGHDGSTPELVVDDEAVVRSEGAGRLIDNFAISADGSVIGFVLKGYAEAGGAYRTKNEVFAYDGGNIIQLTDDTENVYKEHMNMSDDGSTIVYSSGNPQNQYYSIQTNGTSRVAVAEKHSNFQALSLTYDGSQVLYDDGGGRGGRLLNTDGTWGIDLFPEWDVNTIALGISDNGTISDDGSRICFRLQLRSFPSRYALYVGYLYQTGVVADAPVIESITFDPLTMPRGDPDARVTLLAQISDPDGLDDIDEVSTDELVDGVSELGKSEVPVYFYFNARDNGNSPDAVEGDGIFSTRGEPGDRIDELDEVTLRVGAMDMSSTVVVKDAVLQIGGTVGITSNEEIPQAFELLQNYPNPFNASTVIKYSISDMGYVTLTVYDILGKEIETLVAGTKKPGEYEVVFDGNGLASGVYFYRLEAVGSGHNETTRFVKTQKLTMLR